MSCSNLINTCPDNLQSTSATLFLTLLNSLMAAKCSLGNKDDYPEDYGPKLKDGDEFDFIIVGSGSGGSVVANQLSEHKNWKILVVEAGGYPSATSDIPALLFNLQRTNEDWAFRTEPVQNSCLGFKDKKCNWPRGKVLGGSTVLNAMLYVKANQRNYDNWAQQGNIGWNWDSIKNYFTKIENVHSPMSEVNLLGTKGLLNLTKIINDEPVKLAMQEGYEDLGIPHLVEQNPERPVGTVDIPLCIDKGQRSNVGKYLLGTIKNRPNLHVALDSFAQKIIIDPIQKAARGIEVKIRGRVLKLSARKEVIISAGSISSPQLLMLSGIGPADHLKQLDINVVKDLPVGKHMRDHLIYSGFIAKLDQYAFKIPKSPVDPLYEYFMHKSGPLSSVSVTNFLSFHNTKNNSMWPNMGFHYVGFPAHDTSIFRDVQFAIGFNEDATMTLMQSCNENPCLLVIPTLLRPKSYGKILLKSKNPEDYPLIYSGYMTDKNNEDVKVMIEAIRFFEKLMETESLRRHNPELIKLPLPACDKLKYKSDFYWECSLRHLGTTLYHPTSTCRMGPTDDGRSVVDSRLRVHGIKKLRVIDASVMPEITSGNTHAPTMMIGLKGSDMIKEDWL